MLLTAQDHAGTLAGLEVFSSVLGPSPFAAAAFGALVVVEKVTDALWAQVSDPKTS